MAFLYDEDIENNNFFVQLRQTHSVLYEMAAEARLTILVPCSLAIDKVQLVDDDFPNHILIPDESAPGAFRTANGKEVKVNGQQIECVNGFEKQKTVSIMFEESYFNSKDESFPVICISGMLEGGNDASPTVKVKLKSLEDCIEVLWADARSKKTQKSIDELIEVFNRHSSKFDLDALNECAEIVMSVFSKAFQIVGREATQKRIIRQCPPYENTLKLAVETYVSHGIFRKLFRCITAFEADDDRRINKITRNLSAIHIKDLAVQAGTCSQLPSARKELNEISRFSSPLGKLYCLQRVVDKLVSRKSICQPFGEGAMSVLTSDDLLPMLIFLIIKSDVTNWSSILIYLKRFRFVRSQMSELDYYLTTLEAALDYILSGQIKSNHDSLYSLSEIGKNEGNESQTGNVFRNLVNAIKEGDVVAVTRIIDPLPTGNEVPQEELCHPLCSCDKCERIHMGTGNHSNPFLMARTNEGMTALHLAALCGHVDICEYLIKKKATVDSTNYRGCTPLHVACQRGHQGILLLLVHYNADINYRDADQNTPLHYASLNGHDDCVKALLYSGVCDIDAMNSDGDTPIHLASRWGYNDIVEALIVNSVLLDIRNKKNMTPLDCANNIIISNILRKVIEKKESSSADEFIHVEDSPPVASNFLRNRSLSTDSGNEAQLSTKRPSLLEEDLRQVDVVVRAISDGDIQMVKFHLGINEDENEHSGDEVEERELCHPLCTCEKCAPHQRASSKNRFDVNTCGRQGLNALHYAAMNGHHEIVHLLTKYGADVNTKDRTRARASALHLACKFNRIKAIETLLTCGADPRSVDGRNNTPLHYAVLAGTTEPITLLLNAEANINAQNDNGNSPLHEAVRLGFGQVVRVLLENKASTKFRNAQQLTPIDIASEEIEAVIRECQDAGSQPATPQTGKERKRAEIQGLLQSIQNFDSTHTLRSVEIDDRSDPLLLAKRLQEQLSTQREAPGEAVPAETPGEAAAAEPVADEAISAESKSEKKLNSFSELL